MGRPILIGIYPKGKTKFDEKVAAYNNISAIYRDNVIGYTVRNEYHPDTKTEYSDIRMTIRHPETKAIHEEHISCMGDFMIRIKEAYEKGETHAKGL